MLRKPKGTPPPTMIDLYAELKAVLHALEARALPYALCGRLALMVYQRPRATVDIDLILPAEVIDRCKDQGPDAFPGSNHACT